MNRGEEDRRLELSQPRSVLTLSQLFASQGGNNLNSWSNIVSPLKRFVNKLYSNKSSHQGYSGIEKKRPGVDFFAKASSTGLTNSNI